MLSLCPPERIFSTDETQALVNGIDFPTLDSPRVREAMADYTLGVRPAAGH